jgi:phosphoribosylaminoimidazole carboxylase (NCAIR synthetase)
MDKQRVAVIVSSIPSDYFGIDPTFKPLADKADVKIHWILPPYSGRVNRSPFTDTEHFLPLTTADQMTEFVRVLVGGDTERAQLLFTSEYEIELVAGIGRNLNLPAISLGRAREIRDKLVMKDVAAKSGIRVPQYRRVSSRSDVAEMLAEFPRVVVKPVLGTGSVNTHFVDNVAQLDGLEQVVFDGTLEVEEYIEGPMYHVDAIVRDGVPVLLEVGQYTTSVALYRTPGLQATVFSLDGHLRERIRLYLARIVDAFGITDDVVHLEVFNGPGDELVFCELALRPGGGGIPQCIEAKYGVNVFEEHFLAQMGLPSRCAGRDCMSDAVWSAKTTGLFWRYSSRRGVVARVTSYDELASTQVFFSKIDVRVGSKVGVSRFAGLPLALFGVFGATEDAVLSEIRELNERFVVELEPSNP